MTENQGYMQFLSDAWKTPQGMDQALDAQKAYAASQQRGYGQQNDTVDARYIPGFESAKLSTDHYRNGFFPVRILPHTANCHSEMGPVFCWWEYKLRSIDSRQFENVACARTVDPNYDDPLRRLQQELWDMGDYAREIAKALYPRQQHAFFCVLRRAELYDQQTGQKVWYQDVAPKVCILPEKTGNTVLWVDAEGSAYPPYFINAHPATGRDLLLKRELTRVGKATYPKWDGTQWASMPRPAGNDEQLAQWMSIIYTWEESGFGLDYEYTSRVVDEDRLQAYADLIRQKVEQAQQGHVTVSTSPEGDETGELPAQQPAAGPARAPQPQQAAATPVQRQPGAPLNLPPPPPPEPEVPVAPTADDLPYEEVYEEDAQPADAQQQPAAPVMQQPPVMQQLPVMQQPPVYQQPPAPPAPPAQQPAVYQQPPAPVAAPMQSATRPAAAPAHQPPAVHTPPAMPMEPKRKPRQPLPPANPQTAAHQPPAPVQQPTAAVQQPAAAAQQPVDDEQQWNQNFDQHVQRLAGQQPPAPTA